MKTKYTLFTIMAASIILVSNTLFAQEDVDFIDMSLEDLMNMEITVASYEAKTIREQPGIITVITEEQIKRIGARDLIDVLNLVPGFRFAGDVTEMVGIGTRGIWANEGKILILMDGIEWNESLYGTLQFGKHFSADLIKQIEIIRGPGSSMYGGSAEMAVIKITTIGKDAEGVYASAIASTDFNNGIDSKYNLALGDSKEELSYSASLAFQNDVSRSNEMLTTADGDTYDMSTESYLIDPYTINFGVEYSGLSVLFIKDQYQYKLRDYYSGRYATLPISEDHRTEIFNSTLMAIHYKKEIGKLTIVPKLTRKIHESWQNEHEGGAKRLNIKGDRITGSLTAMYKVFEKAMLTFGSEVYFDKGVAGEMVDNDRDTYFGNDGSELGYWNSAVFAQYEMATPFFDFAAGGRYESHEYAGSKFVPRVAITKVLGDFHTKILASQAFRTPNVDVINYSRGIGNDIVSETTNALEFELGYKITDQLLVVANGYYISVSDPIYYGDDGAGGWGYLNGDQVSTTGAEAELRFVPKWGDLRFSYAYYQAVDQGVDLWKSTDSKRNIGFPNNQFSYDLSVFPIKNLTFNLNGFVTSGILSYAYNPAQGAEMETEFDSKLIVNTAVSYKWKKLDFMVGVSDLFNQKELFVPAYYNESGAIPSNGFEVIAKIAIAL